ncbi:hypothetical protein [Spiroplasma ixodetis]
MMMLATNSNLQDVGNKIITIGMPILISLARLFKNLCIFLQSY